MIHILVPLALREHTDGCDAVAVTGDTVMDALGDLVTRHPSLRRYLYADDGALRGYVNVYLNDDEVRSLTGGIASRVGAGDTLMIVPSIAGG